MSTGPIDPTGWLTTAQIEARLRALAAARPDLCQVTALDPPPTAGGPSIIMLRVARPTGGPKIPVLITGGLHAREWAPPDALVDLATLLVQDCLGPAPAYRAKVLSYAPFTKNLVEEVALGGKILRVPKADPPAPFPRVLIAKSAIKTIFDRLEVFIIPLVNPDGRTFSLSGTTRGQQSWRKNRQPTGATCVDPEGIDRGIGTDINRNFDVAWDLTKYYSPAYLALRDPFGLPMVKVATTPCPAAPTPAAFAFAGTFHGTAPESAPEAQRVAEVIRSKNIRYMMDVHSALGRVFYPWGMGTIVSDRARNMRNPTLDGPAVGRTAADGSATDGEYMSPTLKGMASTTAGRIRDGIRHMRTPDVRRTTEPQFESEYVPMPALALYSTTGSVDDYQFALQYAAPTPPAFLAIETLPRRLGFTIECGKAAEGGEGGFFPSRRLEYPKIAREVHMACWSLLAYAGDPARAATATWPIKTV